MWLLWTAGVDEQDMRAWALVLLHWCVDASQRCQCLVRAIDATTADGDQGRTTREDQERASEARRRLDNDGDWHGGPGDPDRLDDTDDSDWLGDTDDSDWLGDTNDSDDSEVRRAHAGAGHATTTTWPYTSAEIGRAHV